MPGTLDWVVARNVLSVEARGSIHDDESARRLGFTGGLVPGNVHVVLAARAVVERVGSTWYERGFMRHTWVKPVYDGEEVRVVLDDDPPGLADELVVRFRLEDREGSVKAAGMAGVAADAAGPPPAPWERDDAPAVKAVGDYDPLPREDIGHTYEEQDITVTPERVARSLGDYDDIPWYRTESPWGDPVVPTVAQLVLGGRDGPRIPDTPRPTLTEMAPGMNATSEILQTGPMFIGRGYRRTAVLVEKGAEGRHCFRTIELSIHDDRGVVVSRSRWRIKWITTRPDLA